MHFIIGTRGSKLALAQAEYVKNRLNEQYPLHRFSLKVIKTTGDRVQNVSLGQLGGKGVFVREIERQLIEGEIHLAVHSMKDMPAEQPKGLCFARSWTREDPRDVLVLREASSLEELPERARIGTGSLRRRVQLGHLRPDLEFVDIRGNIDTRLAKMETQQLDGIVLAAAGLNRLGKENLITQYLEPEQVIPAPAQGTLAIELRAEEKELLSLVNGLSEEKADLVTRTERVFVQEMGLDCRTPAGAYASCLENGKIRLLAALGSVEDSQFVRIRVEGISPEETAKKAALRIQRPGSI